MNPLPDTGTKRLSRMAEIRQLLRTPFSARLIACAGTLILLSWGLLALDLWSSHVRKEEAAHTQAATIARTMDERVARTIRVADQLLKVVGAELEERKSWADARVVTHILQRLDPQLDEILSIAFVNAQGFSIGHSNPKMPVGLNYRDRDYFRVLSAAPDLGLFIDRPVVGQASGQRVFTASRRISGTDGAFLGVLVAVIRTDALAADFAGLTIGQKGAVDLFHIPSRRIIVRQPEYQGTFAKVLPEGLPESLSRTPQGIFRVSGIFDGEERIFAYRQVGKLPLAVSAGLSVSESRAELMHQLAVYLTMAIVLSMFICGGTVLLLRAYRREAYLQESAFKWEKIFEHAGWGIVVGSADGQILEQMNPAYARMHGYSVEELTGQALETVYPPEARADITRHIAQSLQQGHHRYESFHQHRDGHVFPVLIDVSIVRDEAGKMLYRVVNVQDISEIRHAQDEMRIAKEFFQHTFDAAPVGIAIVDVDGRFTQVNPAMREFIGYSEAELLVMNFVDITHPEDVEPSSQLLQSLLDGQCRSFQMEKRYVHKDGREVWGLVVVSLNLDREGRPLHLIAQLLDIDRLKRADEALRISERKLAETAQHEGERFKQAILDSVSSQMAVLDRHGVIVAVNESWRRFAEENSAEPGKPALHTEVGVNYLDICAASHGEWSDRADDARAGILMVLEGRLPSFRLEYPCHSPQRHRWFTMSVTAMATENRGVVVSHSDITESRKKLRALAAHHEAMLEQERKHIARELHDELGQLLTALKMDISLLRLRFSDIVPLREMAEEMRSLVERTISVVRNVASNLRPAALNHGLLPAIEWLAEEFAGRWSISCRIEAGDGEIVLEDLQSTAVFRVVQESLTNVARHARAQKVVISLRQSGQRLQVVVKDDGQGFDMVAVGKGQGFGLFGMRERVLALGGTLHIDSAPGQGTSVFIDLPLTNSEPS